MKTPVQSGAPKPNRYNVPIHNASGEEIPAYAVVEVDSVSNFGEDTLYEVKKPTTGATERYLINSPASVPVGGYGAATNQYPVDALVDGSPTIGDEIGPSSSSWELGTGTRFTYLGGLVDGVGRVMALGAGGGNDSSLIRATASIAAGSGDPRTPATSSSYEQVKGPEVTGNIENWTTVSIDDNAYVVVTQIDGDWVIVAAFC